MQWLARKTPNTPLRPPNPALDAATLQQAQRILDAVNDEGVEAVRRIGEDLGDLNADSPLIYTRDDLQAALAEVIQKMNNDIAAIQAG